MIAADAQKIIGRRVSTSPLAGFVRDFFEQAAHYRRPIRAWGWFTSATVTAKYLSIKQTQRLAEAGIKPYVGSVGDSHDTALAETTNSVFKAEVSISAQGTVWRDCLTLGLWLDLTQTAQTKKGPWQLPGERSAVVLDHRCGAFCLTGSGQHALHPGQQVDTHLAK